MSKDVNFVVYASDGGKPDVQVCAAGFTDEEGIDASVHVEGGARDIAYLLTSIASRFAADLERNQGSEAAGAFIFGLIIETRSSVGIDTCSAVSELLLDAISEMTGKEDE